MKGRHLVVAIAVICMLSIVEFPTVSANQVVHLGFEGLRFYEQEVDDHAPVSITFSLPSQKCLNGIVVVADEFPDEATAVVKVNDVQLQHSESSPTVTAWPTQSICSNTFTVYADVSWYDDQVQTVLHADIEKIILIADDEYRVVKSQLQSTPKYIPPGADGTDQGFLLNKTAILLPQTYSLDEGSLTFWLKWDGTNVTISDNIKAVVTYDDGGGTVYGGITVTSDDGTEYALENVLVPGVYTKVYIGWTPSGGYIATDNATLNLNWKGNLVLSKVGSLSDDSQSIIDEFNLYDSYVDLEGLKAPNQATVVVTFPNGSTTHIVVTDDSGTLDSLAVSFYTLNNTLLNSTTWKGIGNDITFTTNESMVLAVLSAPGGSTTVLVRPGVNETVAVPGSVVPHLQAIIEPSSYPTGSQRQWTWLVVRDAQGRLVYFNKWNFEGTPVLLKSGESYLVAVATENLTSVYGAYFGLASPSIKITLPSPKDLTKFTNITVFYSVKESDNTFRIYFYDPSGQTSEVNIALYDDGLNPTANVTYHASLVDVKFNTLPFKFTLTYVRNGKEYTWSRVLGYTNAQGIASELGSRKLLGFALIEGMLFAFGSLSAMWAPAVTLAFAIPLSMSGMIELPALIITYLGGMAFFAWFQQVNLDAASLKQLAVKLLLAIFALQMATGVANYYGYIGWGTGGYTSNETIEVAGEQITFWQNYTPTYSSYGIPVSSDSRMFMNFVYAVLNGTGAMLMSLGAPPEFAHLMNTLVWALEGALLLYLLLGREV